jgi:F0F1-type ATP synthase membrane subunit b/b'/ElaB/YqjD/DUF883 family membrane-anchored ribosome-binding protein
MRSISLFIETIFSDGVTFLFCALIIIWLVLAIVLMFKPRFSRREWSSRFIAMTATSLATLGILGTFTGILIGLLHFNVDKIDDSVPDLLAGLKVAFTTSIVGIIAAIVFRLCRTAAPTGVVSDGVGPEDVLRVLSNIRDDGRKGIEQSSQQLRKLRAAISAEGDSSLLTQIQKLRSDSKDNHDALIKEFREFAIHMVENNQKAIIEALEQVIRDFNQNLTEQFGDNFKQLNQAVESLVKWQENYRIHVDGLEGRLDKAVSATESSRKALESVQNHAEQIPKAIEPLGPVLKGLINQTQVLEIHLQAIAALRDKAIETFPVIETNLHSITAEMKNCVQDVLNQSREAISESEKLHDVLRQDQRKLIEEIGTSRKNFHTELVNTLEEMRLQAGEEFEKHRNLIQQALEATLTQMREGVDGVLDQSREAMSESEKLHDALRQDQRSFISEIGSSRERFHSELENALSQMNKHAKDGFEKHSKLIQQAFEVTLTEVNNGVQNALNKSKEAMSESEKLHDALRQDQRSFISEIGSSRERFHSELENALSQMNKHAKDGFDRHTQLIQQAAEGSRKSIDDAWAESVNKMNDQFTNFDSQMQQELNRALQSLGRNLASVSEKLVSDYTPLTERLRELVEVSRRIN